MPDGVTGNGGNRPRTLMGDGLRERRRDRRAKFETWRPTWPGYYLGVIIAVFFAAITAISSYGVVSPANGWHVLAFAISVGWASFFVVGLTGYLFGIPQNLARRDLIAFGFDPDAPRSDGEAQDAHSAHLDDLGYVPNDSLMEISDWLTKIIIGASLVEIREIRWFVSDMGATIESQIPLLAGAQVIFVAHIVLNAVLGFIFFYIWSRVYMPHIFGLGERNGRRPRR